MAEALPRAQLAHHLPRRLRVLVPARKGVHDYFPQAVARLSGRHPIRAVRVSPQTGSITIEHDGQAQEVARLARELGVFDLPEAAVAQRLAERLPGPVAGVEPAAVVSAGLAGLGVYQLLRGQVLGSGVEHLWHAYGAARLLGDVRVAAAMVLLGGYQIARGRILSPATSLLFYALMLRAMRARR